MGKERYTEEGYSEGVSLQESLSQVGDPVIALKLISSALNKMLGGGVGGCFNSIFKVRERRDAVVKATRSQ